MHKTLIVIDSDDQYVNADFLEVISFETYLNDYPKIKENKTRIINLCDSENYLGKGYYCSLLAEARGHESFPSVKTINELRALKEEENPLINFKLGADLVELNAEPIEYLIYFGYTEVPALQTLAKKIFIQYPAPILKVSLSRTADGLQLHIERFAQSLLRSDQTELFLKKLLEFTQTIWRVKSRRKRYRWDMAILINAEEKVPPSNKEAISRFIKAAGKHGIQAEAVSIDELQYISNYDALFIRETTAINHHTYRLACKAENNGVVVLDDPASILRCCNKVFLHDAFSYQHVPSLKSKVIIRCDTSAIEEIEACFAYPIVLKMPEGSFSKGVFKVENRDALTKKLQELFQYSALILAQEYIYTDFDWRIGVLNGRAIYACKYLMARNHWQIYNHSAKRMISGGFETLPTFEVPKIVLDAALKASKAVGNGLYGVDIKQVDKQVFVLEVNDNPSIDHKIEDEYLGDELYMQIMAEFTRRLESRGTS